MSFRKAAASSRTPSLGAFGLYYDALSLFLWCASVFVASVDLVEQQLFVSLLLIFCGVTLRVLGKSARAHREHDFEIIPKIATARFEQSRFMQPSRADEMERRAIIDALLRTQEDIISARERLDNEAGAIVASSFIIAIAMGALSVSCGMLAFRAVAAAGPTSMVVFPLAALAAAASGFSLLAQPRSSIARLRRLLDDAHSSRGVADYHVEATSEAMVGDRAKLAAGDYAEAVLLSLAGNRARDAADIAAKILADTDPRFMLKPPVARRR
jgi:hypothetical protein